MRLPTLALFLAVFCVVVGDVSGVILLDATAGNDPNDPNGYGRNTTTPGDNSGWQYQGQFGAFLGTPIAPFYFVTAAHIGGSLGQPFTFHGETYTTTAAFPDPSTDLQIWQVDHAFPVYAPLYQGPGTEPGKELRVFGRGTRRGGELYYHGTLRGWAWGDGDGVERWGRNLVASIVPNGDWPFIQAAFDNPGLASEAHLSVGDSGGGLFILQNGLWCLAGINYGVDDVSTTPSESTAFSAAIFDARDYYEENDDHTFTQVTGPANVPTSFYCTEVAARLAWIQSVTGSNPAVLPTESFAAWQRAYFTPGQIADDAAGGPDADPDHDGVVNRLEFAFNLDPTYAEPVTMTAGTGLRGLPLVGVAQVGKGDRRLTVEFVRRTAASGSGVAYAAQFTTRLEPGLIDWEASGVESVTPINARWERVKVTDTVSLGSAVPTRFGRVVVTAAAGVTSDVKGRAQATGRPQQAKAQR